jgi:hypothetical protein
LQLVRCKQIVFQRDVSGNPFIEGNTGEMVYRDGRVDVKFSEIFSILDKN